MDFLPAAFEALKHYRQFIIYKLVPSANRPGKTDKFPLNYKTGIKHNAHDSSIWIDCDTAIAQAKRYGADHGVGFSFTKNDPFFFVDIDNCLLFDKDEHGNKINMRWSRDALMLLNALPGAAVEVSSSGEGLHIVGVGDAPAHGIKNKTLDADFYTSGRFIALTGWHAGGSVAHDCSAVLPGFVEKFFKKEVVNGSAVEGDWRQQWEALLLKGREVTWAGAEDNEELLSRMLLSKSTASIFGGRASFKDLWERNEQVLRESYPDRERQGGYDESSAEMALAQKLAYYTGNDGKRMRELMLKSALYREKFEREDYLPRTLLAACARQKEWTMDKPVLSIAQGTGSLSTYISIEEQKEYFKGCAYILSSNRILIPGGLELNEAQFKSWYGGKSFPMDYENRRTVRNAWEAFNESQALSHTKVHGTTFKPKEAPGAIIEEEGRTYINTYYPLNIPRKKGDASPFLRHLSKIFIEEREATIILSYLASLVRYIGTKFDWCPLIQGVEGNGKSLISEVAQALVGKRYTQLPRVKDIGERFNNWTYGTCLVLVEDVRDKKRDLIEVLKPMITLSRQSVEPKFENQRSADVCFNFIMNTNHRDGLHKTRNDRRIAPFFLKQQRKEDLKRDGMDSTYFKQLWDWCLYQDGFAILADFFDNYDIPSEFNPTEKCRNAPVTSATEASIEEGVGGVEQEILEATEQGVMGFKDGWISSVMLDGLLNKLKANSRIPLNKRREMLKTMGYEWHPALKEGRVNNIVLPDGAKPRLFIKEGHRMRDLQTPSDVARAYTEAQV